MRQVWTAVATIVAVCALGLSIYTSYLNRDYLRRSNRPEMQVSFFFNNEGSGFMFGNTGLGPAYLEWFQILVDGKPQPSWLAMGAALGFKSPPQRARYGRPGRMFQVDSYDKIFWVPPGPLDQELRANRKRIDIRTCYCSIFDECWIESDKVDPHSVNNCEPFPKIRYGGADAPGSRP